MDDGKGSKKRWWKVYIQWIWCGCDQPLYLPWAWSALINQRSFKAKISLSYIFKCNQLLLLQFWSFTSCAHLFLLHHHQHHQKFSLLLTNTDWLTISYFSYQNQLKKRKLFNWFYNLYSPFLLNLVHRLSLSLFGLIIIILSHNITCTLLDSPPTLIRFHLDPFRGDVECYTSNSMIN